MENYFNKNILPLSKELARTLEEPQEWNIYINENDEDRSDEWKEEN